MRLSGLRPRTLQRPKIRHQILRVLVSMGRVLLHALEDDPFQLEWHAASKRGRRLRLVVLDRVDRRFRPIPGERAAPRQCFVKDCA